MNKKLCISGMSDSYRDAEQYFQTHEIWTLNQAYLVWREIESHATAWFDLHTPEKIATQRGHLKWMQEKRAYPLYTQVPFKGVDSIIFPKDSLINFFGRYFTSSISWMLAFAIHQGFEEIVLAGVDMTEGAYLEQRSCCEYYIGMARGRGITVKTSMCKDQLLYGYETNTR